MCLSEKEWDEAKQFGQYLLEQGEDESEAVVEFRRQDLAAYLGMLGFAAIAAFTTATATPTTTQYITRLYGWLFHSGRPSLWNSARASSRCPTRLN